jgi:hypothetical protein
MGAFLDNLYFFGDLKWKHYKMTRRQITKRGRRGSVIPLDLMDHTTYKLSSCKTGTRIDEKQNLELIDVKLLSSIDWLSVLDAQLNSLLTRNWKFSENLSPETLDRLHTELGEYEGRTDLRDEERKKKRKRNQSKS